MMTSVHRLLILLCALLLSGCVPASPDPTVLPTSEAARIVTVGDEARLLPAYDAVRTALQQRAPDLALQPVALPSNTLLSQNATTMAQSADVIVARVGDRATARQFMRDLRPLRDADPTFSADAYWPAIADACSVDGVLFGLPIAIEPLVLFADATAFTRAGLPLPDTRWSWDSFTQTARALAQSGAAPRYGFAPVGGMPFARLTPTPDADTQRQYAEYVALGSAGVVPPGARDLEQLVADGRVAMWTDTLAQFARHQQQRGDALVVLPFPGDHTPAEPICAMISQGSALPDEAWDVVQVIGQQSIRPDSWELPAQRQLASEQRSLERLDPAVRARIEPALSRLLVDTSPHRAAVAAAITQAANGTRTLEQALAALSPTGGDAPTTPPLTVASPIATGLAQQTIRVSMPALNPALLQPVITAFQQQYPDIRIVITDDTGEAAKVATRVDCLITPDFRLSDKLLDLQPLFERDTSGWRADISPALLDDLRTGSDGQLPGIPLTMLPNVLFANPTILAEQGITAAPEDWTQDDLLRVMEQGARPDAEPPTYGFAPIQPYDLLVALRGIDFATMPFTDPQVQAALEAIAQSTTRGVFPPRSEWNSPQADEYAGTNRLAIWRGPPSNPYNTWTAPDAERAPNTFTMLANPASDIAQRRPLLRLFRISAMSPAPEACLTWGRFISTEAALLGDIPARTSARQQVWYQERFGAANARAIETYLTGPFAPIVSRGLILDVLLGQEISAAELPARLEAAEAAWQGYAGCRAATSDIAQREACITTMINAVVP